MPILEYPIYSAGLNIADFDDGDIIWVRAMPGCNFLDRIDEELGQLIRDIEDECEQSVARRKPFFNEQTAVGKRMQKDPTAEKLTSLRALLRSQDNERREWLKRHEAHLQKLEAGLRPYEQFWQRPGTLPGDGPFGGEMINRQNKYFEVQGRLNKWKSSLPQRHRGLQDNLDAALREWLLKLDLPTWAVDIHEDPVDG